MHCGLEFQCDPAEAFDNIRMFRSDVVSFPWVFCEVI